MQEALILYIVDEDGALGPQCDDNISVIQNANKVNIITVWFFPALYPPGAGFLHTMDASPASIRYILHIKYVQSQCQ